ncbi:MAG TPA: hypothetical protein VK815_03935, partial [Candidatus Acidoferrales bacterium]|nr:hypothetical protein [Candidatus Acidoferrales bacterium]
RMAGADVKGTVVDLGSTMVRVSAARGAGRQLIVAQGPSGFVRLCQTLVLARRIRSGDPAVAGQTSTLQGGIESSESLPVGPRAASWDNSRSGRVRRKSAAATIQRDSNRFKRFQTDSKHFLKNICRRPSVSFYRRCQKYDCKHMRTKTIQVNPTKSN